MTPATETRKAELLASEQDEPLWPELAFIAAIYLAAWAGSPWTWEVMSCVR